ncbi:hypothetical protein JKP88DRAFT_277944 [Tribonema minus]|uniref:Uncharacterized protein n=1 Tax=Tribonema minus TaxID=303371 RepID=A0A835YXL2_9STRA|nr:hypothetical protein JKP88DRAFT_277944 [Tribonema minus]
MGDMPPINFRALIPNNTPLNAAEVDDLVALLEQYAYCFGVEDHHVGNGLGSVGAIEEGGITSGTWRLRGEEAVMAPRSFPTELCHLILKAFTGAKAVQVEHGERYSIRSLAVPVASRSARVNCDEVAAGLLFAIRKEQKRLRMDTLLEDAAVEIVIKRLVLVTLANAGLARTDPLARRQLSLAAPIGRAP